MMQNLFWCLIGIVGGAIVSTIFYFISQKRKSLTYDITTTTLVSDNCSKLKGLNVSYKNKSIRNLYASNIKIKNTGNSVIELSDFAPSAPLSLETNDEFLITPENDNPETTSILTSNSYNRVYPSPQFNADLVCTKANIHFDYISKKEILTCTVFHTGSIKISGKLKDGKLINEEDKPQYLIQASVTIISAIIGAVFTGIFSFFLNKSPILYYIFL